MSDRADVRTEANAGTKRGTEAERAHEVRLGLVLYGGVSLAIYMNGTTNELFRAVRGRGVYLLIKHLLDADITVDVASGASAGGINGIFLSFALANGREFGTCADLWRRDGDLGSLLRKVDGAAVPSVLDSEHYRDVLENGFRVMWENERHPDEPELPSATRELDLFVTGTNFYGRYSQAVDSTGRVIETKQHRTVFLLKHRDRAGSKCQLDPRRNARGGWDLSDRDRGDGLDAPQRPPEPDVGLLSLAKLAQITSCFPGAFAAVHVDATDGGTDTPMGQADQRLKVWGLLPEGDTYFVDGGVLDNKPFTTTLDTIFHRPAHRRVCRHVLYLEPDPERFPADKRGKRDAEGRFVAPTFISSVLDSVTRLPSYESIADDLARIAEHNASIQRFDELVKALGTNGGAPPSQGTYLLTRLLAVGQRVNAELAEALGSLEFVPAGGEQHAKVRLSSEAIGNFLKELTKRIQEVTAEERGELLKALDVDFYLRQLLALTYALEERSDDPKARELWKHVNQEIQWLEIVRSAMERVVVPGWMWQGGDGFDVRLENLDTEKVWQEIALRARMLLDPRALTVEPPPPTFPAKAGAVESEPLLAEKERQRALFRQALESRLKAVQALDAAAVARAEPHPTLLERCDERLDALIAASGVELRDFPRQFREREDPLRFPLEFAARVHQRDKINLVRLSPFDAQSGYSRRSLEDKISGETFGHFGAFLKKSWRSNDILWGRLDGISRLVETLLVHTDFEGPESDRGVERVRAALGATHGDRRTFLGRLFPHLHARIAAREESHHDELAALLDLLESDSALDRSTLVKVLTETAQLDALCEDLPKVIADAAEEQLAWGQRKIGGLPGGRSPTAGRTLVALEQAATKAEARAKAARAKARELDGEASKAELDARKARAKAERVKTDAAPDTASAPPKLRFSPETWQFEATGAALDTNVVNLATRVLAEQSLAQMSPAALGQYFTQEYAVGSETAFVTMPVTVLADLGAHATVLAEHALLGSGPGGDALRDNGLYRLVVHWPLKLIAALAAFLRRSPQYRVSLVVGSLLYAALALVANLVFAGSLYREDGVSRTVAVWAFALLPFTALVFAWVIWRSRVGKRALVGGLLVAAALTVWWKSDDIARELRVGCVRQCFDAPPDPCTDAFEPCR